jgi:hypothetical protein
MESFNACKSFNEKMKLYPIETGNFKLDGGAMFGLYKDNLSQLIPADANNLIDIAARCLLIEDGDRLILIDTGMGNKQEIFLVIFIGGHIPWIAC